MIANICTFVSMLITFILYLHVHVLYEDLFTLQFLLKKDIRIYPPVEFNV